MKAWKTVAATAALSGLLFGGCAALGPPPTVVAPPTAQAPQDYIIYSPVTWSGDVRVVRPILVTKTGSLTLQPGTRVFFDLPEPAAGKERPPWILVLGSLVALGTPEQRILFSSLELRQNELDDMIQAQGAKEVHLRHCVFERGPWGLHVHDTPVDVTAAEFRENYGGARFQGGRVALTESRFTGNRIGVRCLNASPSLQRNTFTGNLTGVFLRQGVENAVLRQNNFDNQEYDLKLGEGQTHDVDARENWWKAGAAGRLAERIYDGADAQGLGRVATEPTLPAPWAREVKKP
ncbi:MAG: NosD domain-containing protein [Deferrisomatales bacterium]